MERIVLSLLLIGLAAPAWGATKLPSGLCPFDQSKIAANFTSELRRDYKNQGIEADFSRRERWYGPCKSAKPLRTGQYLFEYENATATVELQMRGSRVEQYGWSKLDVKTDSWERLSKTISSEWPASSLCVSDGKDVRGFRQEEHLNVGDGHNLLVHAVAEKKIQAGQLKNDQAFKLLSEDKAEEFDSLAEKKAGTAVKLSELKKYLYGSYDRTAGDMLLRIVGPEAVASSYPGSEPVLSRREFNWLMTLPKEAMAKLKREEAKSVAAKLAKPKSIPPLAPERYDHLNKIQWKASCRQLCDALLSVKDVAEVKGGQASLNFRALHPTWAGGVYQASRESGVSQTTWVAQLPGQNKPTCFSLTINANDFIDEGLTEEVLSRADSLLKQEASSRVSEQWPLTCMKQDMAFSDSLSASTASYYKQR